MFRELLEELQTPKTLESDFSTEDIFEIIQDLDQDELNEVGEFIMELIYEEDFDEEDLEESEEFKDIENLDEKQYFKTKKSHLDRAKKRNTTQRLKDKKLRKKYYKKNKAKLKRKNKLYRKKVKRQPNIQKKHRK